MKFRQGLRIDGSYEGSGTRSVGSATFWALLNPSIHTVL
jgi:hypothetical protein